MARASHYVFSACVVTITLCLLPAPISSRQQSAPPKGSIASGDPQQVAGTPADGFLNAGVYTNRYFGFSLNVPEGWITIGNPGTPESMRNGKDGERAYALLAIGSKDKPLHGTRWIAISAASPLAPNLTADGYMRRFAQLNEIAQSRGVQGSQNYRVTGPPSRFILGGKRFTRVDIRAQVDVQGGTYDTHASMFAMESRECMLIINVSDPAGRESEKQAAAQIIKFLRFFPTDGK